MALVRVVQAELVTDLLDAEAKVVAAPRQTQGDGSEGFRHEDGRGQGTMRGGQGTVGCGEEEAAPEESRPGPSRARELP